MIRVPIHRAVAHPPANPCWVDFEWRWKTAAGRALRQAKNFSQPPRLGAQAVEGKTLLLYCERGLGDTLQFCRYALMVSQLHAKVILQETYEVARNFRSSRDLIKSPEELPNSSPISGTSS
jgi:hypothetical protein